MTLFNSNTNMKKLLLSLAAILMASAAFNLSAQEVEAETKAAAEELSETAAAAAAEPEKEMKTGWSFGILPTATFSVDNGFQAGAFGDV